MNNMRSVFVGFKGVMLLVLSIFVITGFAKNSYAQENDLGSSKFDINVYGEVYMDFFYNDSGFAPDIIPNGISLLQQSGSSNLGIDVSYGNTFALLEVGLSLGEIIRRLYIGYEFENESKIIFGRDTTIATYTFGQMAFDENGLAGAGTLGSNQYLQIRYEISGFQIALVNNETAPDIDSIMLNIPHVEATYNFSIGDSDETLVFFSLGYFTFDKIVDQTTDDEILFDPLIAGTLGAGGNVEIGFFTLNYSAFAAYNGELLGVFTLPLFNYDDHSLTGKAHNILSFGGAIGLEFDIMSMFSVGAGVGYMGSTSSDPLANSVDNSIATYLNFNIPIGKYFAIYPEVGYIINLGDVYGNTHADQSAFYGGLHLVATFE